MGDVCDLGLATGRGRRWNPGVRNGKRVTKTSRAEVEFGEGFWRERAEGAVAEAGTPALVFAEEPLAAQARRLETALAGLPVRSWWSFKTLPLRPAVSAWRGWGHGVEVVSEYELRAVLGMGVPAADILVNGPAKQAWLLEYGVPGLRVNFDSAAEVQALAPTAARRGWRVGLRLNTSTEENFEFPGIRTQFGLLAHEVKPALRVLKREGLVPGVLHFHLRTNVAEARCYREAAMEALGVAAEAGWTPKVLDIGGGFPPEQVATRKGTPLDAGFSLASLREALVGVRGNHRFLEEIWMENGRWLTAPSGVLVVRVMEVKEGRGLRTLICDGGRTLQAMVATWERHTLFALEPRRGKPVRTLVCGPTCMAFDNLGLHELASTVRAGDRLVWRDAGAYQLSWETRFSHGLGAVVWTAASRREVVRAKEMFEGWVSGR